MAEVPARRSWRQHNHWAVTDQGCLHAEPIETDDIRRGNPTRLGKCCFARLAGKLTQCLTATSSGRPDTTISWYRNVERRGPGLRPPALKPGFAGGEV